MALADTVRRLDRVLHDLPADGAECGAAGEVRLRPIGQVRADLWMVR